MHVGSERAEPQVSAPLVRDAANLVGAVVIVSDTRAIADIPQRNKDVAGMAYDFIRVLGHMACSRPPGELVGVQTGAVLEAENPIPIGQGAGPLPARIGFGDLAPEPFNGVSTCRSNGACLRAEPSSAIRNLRWLDEEWSRTGVTGSLNLRSLPGKLARLRAVAVAVFHRQEDDAACRTRSREVSTSFMDGRVDEVAYGKSVPGGITSIRSELVTRLYNGGTGRAWNWQ